MTDKPPGPDIIRDFVRTLPSSPGVYRMLDEKGDVVYVGKARNLKARVTNYTRLEGNPLRIQRMIMATRSMEFVRTGTESEALLLEANLIKRLRPRFNVLLRDDKSFPYILIATEHEAPELTKHRGVTAPKGLLFRPLRLGHRRGAHHRCAAKGVSAAQLLGQFLCQPARGRVCSTRSSAAPPPAPAKSPFLTIKGSPKSARQFLSGKSKTVQDQLLA